MTINLRIRVCAARTVLVAALPACALRAQTSSTQSALLYRLGRDTTAVERFTASPGRLEGDIVQRDPTTRVHHYVLLLRPDGSAADLEYEKRLADGSPSTEPGIVGASFHYDADSITVVRRWRDSTQQRRVASKGPTFPFVVAGWYGLYQPAIAWARAHRDATDSVVIRAMPVANTSTIPWPIVFRGSQQVDVTWFFNKAPYVLHTDQRNAVTSGDARQTTVKEVAEAIPASAFDAMLASFVDRDRRGMSFGAVSSRDTVLAAVGDARLWIDYGRPSKRGRLIFGGIVPLDSVWRVGANAATQFRTDKALRIGGTPVPAGLYSLWVIPSATGPQLVINGQAGQWGTQYDAAKDFARVPMSQSTLSASVERMTVAIETTSSGAALVVTWDTTRLAVPIQPAP